MSEQSPRDENPCRPRHYKPDPCGPAAPPEGPARESLDTSHTRLLHHGGIVLPRLLVDRAAASSR